MEWTPLGEVEDGLRDVEEEDFEDFEGFEGWERRELPQGTVILITSCGYPTDVLVADHGPIFVSAAYFGVGLTNDDAIVFGSDDNVIDLILDNEPQHYDVSEPGALEELRASIADDVEILQKFDAAVLEYNPTHIFVTM